MKTIAKSIILLSLIAIFSCTKEKYEYPKKYKMVEFIESSIDLYSTDGIIENHSYTFDSINKLEFFESYLIHEIFFTSKNNASFRFPPSEEQALWELMGENLYVTYKNDSIFFTKELIVDNYDLSTDVRGKFKNDNIFLTGVFFELHGVYTSLWGMQYHPYSIESALEYIWDENSQNTDTLKVYHFALEFAEFSE